VPGSVITATGSVAQITGSSFDSSELSGTKLSTPAYHTLICVSDSTAKQSPVNAAEMRLQFKRSTLVRSTLNLANGDSTYEAHLRVPTSTLHSQLSMRAPNRPCTESKQHVRLYLTNLPSEKTLI